MLAVRPYHNQVRPAIQEVRSKRPGMSLSQVSDAYTSSVMLGCGIEVKESGGDYDEAVVQLGIWCSSGLEKMRSMNTRVMLKTFKPLLGWTVIGREWSLRISWKDKNTGDVVGQRLC